VLFRQFVNEDLGCGSYLVGDCEAGVAVVIDPQFAIGQYLDAAAAEGVRIVRVLETHTHADHLSGHGRLALEHGVPVSIHPLAAPEYPFDPVEDGYVVAVGSLEVRVVHTPGHRPEHCAFVVGGELVLTGDSLFVGEAARPDLAVEARAGAADLYRSLLRLAELPDPVVVYPGHVSGSLCGTNMSDERFTTIGVERRTNHALKLDERAFVDESASLTTPRPPTTERLVALNRGPWVAARPPLDELDGTGGAPVLDVRPVDEFVAGHAPGAISVALDGGSFATRAAFVLEPEAPFVVHARSREDAAAAAELLWAVGVFEAAGFVLETGVPEPMPTVTVPELAALLGADPELQLVDVREDAERDGEPGIPYHRIATALAKLDRARTVYTVCAGGARATLAASILVRAGFDARPLVHGGADDVARERAALVSAR
jgi:hydroxyacylglutathione hydrolase